MKTTTAIIRDIQTKTIVAEYPAEQIKLARRKAEWLNQSYGAIRYVVTCRDIVCVRVQLCAE